MRSYVDLVDVQAVHPGTGVQVKSLTSGETVFVHDLIMSNTLARERIFRLGGEGPRVSAAKIVRMD